MRKVILESPFAGKTEREKTRNLTYARACLRDSLFRGEAPIASHLLYQQVLDDGVPDEREMGISAGHAWVWDAEALVVYQDLGISPGMERGLTAATKTFLPIEFRTLPGWG
jgi:hypothetical protein